MPRSPIVQGGRGKSILGAICMRNVSEYSKCGVGELKLELIEITQQLAIRYTDLATTMADHQTSYLQAYSNSPGGSVAAKNREAQYYTTDLTAQIFEARANINSLILCRDLLVTLLSARPLSPLPFPELGRLDEDACTIA